MTPEPWLVATLVVVIAGIAASAWLWLVKRRQLEADAGIDALADMHLREFSHFTLDAMHHRGFSVADSRETPIRGPQADFTLLRDQRRWLLSCRHGDTRIDRQVVASTVDVMAGHGTIYGILATTNDITADARTAARNARIELLTGLRLWQEVGPLVPEPLRIDARQQATAATTRLIGFAWLAALALGAMCWFALGGLSDDVPQAASESSVATPEASVEPAPAATTGSTPAPPSGQAAEASEEEARREIARLASSLAGVTSADWSSRSTLLLQLQDDAVADAVAVETCALLARHESLATSRLQLQPPPGSAQMVRFHLCRPWL